MLFEFVNFGKNNSWDQYAEIKSAASYKRLQLDFLSHSFEIEYNSVAVIGPYFQCK